MHATGGSGVLKANQNFLCFLDPWLKQVRSWGLNFTSARH